MKEQLVGWLWISGGYSKHIPHRESKPALYAMMEGSRALILAKNGMSDPKCQ